MTTMEALHALHRHLDALGRYGETAFLYPLYGSAEVAQAFCRMCAVWGGTHILFCSVLFWVVLF